MSLSHEYQLGLAGRHQLVDALEIDRGLNLWENTCAQVLVCRMRLGLHWTVHGRYEGGDQTTHHGAPLSLHINRLNPTCRALAVPKMHST